MGAAASNPLPRVLTVTGLAMEAGYLLLGLPDLSLPLRVGIQIALFGAYLVSLWWTAREPPAGRSLQATLALAVLFRLTLLFVPPFYSDDVYRYLWDGHVQVDGHRNPYVYPPAAPELEPLRDMVFPRVNHPEVPTIYPPVSQFLFAAVVGVKESVSLLKGTLILADLLLMAVLLRSLGRVGLPRGQVLIYAWSPLVVVEVAGNGHIDALAILLLVAGIHLIILERPGLSTVALGLSIASKFFSLLTLPVLARRLRPRFWAIPVLVAVATYLPYAGAGSALFAGLREYAERWRHNDALFGALLLCVEWLEPTPVLKAGLVRLHQALDYPGWFEVFYRYAYPVYLARLLAAGIALALAGLLTWRRVDPIRGAFLLLSASLLLSPTLHPWYLLWIAPFLAFRPNRAWILLTGLVPLSYLDPGSGTTLGKARTWIRWVEYAPFFALLLGDAAASFHRGDPVTLFGLRQFPPGRAAAWGEREKTGASPPA